MTIILQTQTFLILTTTKQPSQNSILIYIKVFRTVEGNNLSVEKKILGYYCHVSRQTLNFEFSITASKIFLKLIADIVLLTYSNNGINQFVILMAGTYQFQIGSFYFRHHSVADLVCYEHTRNRHHKAEIYLHYISDHYHLIIQWDFPLMNLVRLCCKYIQFMTDIHHIVWQL